MLRHVGDIATSRALQHTSPHIHHINTPLWIRSRLPTRTPSIALTLILRILEYPLSLVYDLCKGSKFPYMRNPAIRIDNDNPAGVYFFSHALATYHHVHVMYLGVGVKTGGSRVGGPELCVKVGW